MTGGQNVAERGQDGTEGIQMEGNTITLRLPTSRDSPRDDEQISLFYGQDGQKWSFQFY